MFRLPLSPLLAVAVATMSSTGHGDPAPVGTQLDQLGTQLMAGLDREVLSPASYVGDLLAGARDRLIDTLDHLRESSNIAAPDLTALSIEPVANFTTSGFGWREDPITKRRKFHSGADIRGKHGTPVMSAGAGTVIFASAQNGYGNVIYIDHGNGVITRYGHLRKIEVKKDALVTAGQRIGQVGSTGRTTGPHLHFEIRIEGHPVDPTTALMVGRLERESPPLGRMAAQVLSPDTQRAKQSEIDPPKTAKPTKESRPERSNRPKREAKPLS